MPAMNPSKDAMSVVMVQFSPEAATTKETVDRNIKKIESMNNIKGKLNIIRVFNDN